VITGGDTETGVSVDDASVASRDGDVREHTGGEPRADGRAV
jgi:hypothetical protein